MTTPGTSEMTAGAHAFALTEDQLQLRGSVRAFLESRSDETQIRRIIDTPGSYDRAVWTQMARQLGLHGLAIPDRFGGGGFSFAELGVVLEEMGRALLPGPFFGSVVLAGSILLQCDDEDVKARLLPGIASGDTIAAAALTEESGRWDADGVGVRASYADGSWSLSGTKTYVLDGDIADLVLVTARTDAGVALFAVEAFDQMNRRQLSTLDPTRRQARLDFVDCNAALIGEAGDAWPALSRALDIAAAGLAAEQVGAAQRCLDLAVDYAKTRKQFGKPIGSFQAIRHKCADLMLQIECARGAAQYAVHTAAHIADELPAAASLAKAYCSDAFVAAAAANIQIHGGIGFTWEHPAHLYFKRAKSTELLLGDAAYHRRLLADRVGL